MRQSKRDLREGDVAGDKDPRDLVHNDLSDLSVRPNFFKLYKLSSIKAWHIRGHVIQGIHLTYKNPQSGHLVTVGPHVCNSLEEQQVSSAVLELDSDEYLEEVRGFHNETVNYVLFRTSKGKYAEFGDPRNGNEFRFRAPKGNHIICISYGFNDYTLKFLEITLAPLAFMPSIPVPPPQTETLVGPPRIIQRTDYLGAEDKSGTVVDDFFALNLHPSIRENQVRIVQISALHSRHLLGMEVIYQVGSDIKSTSYNFNPQRHANSTKHCLELEEGEVVTEVACVAEGRYITCMTLVTSTGHHLMCGHQPKGERMQALTPKDCAVLAFRGMFDQEGVQALMMYYL